MKNRLFTACSLLAATAVVATGCDSVEVTGVEVAHFQGDRQAAVSLTFDDGMLCHYTDVAPALEANGLRGTFWIIGSNMGKDEPEYPWMTWEQVADLSRRGHEISNHSWTHPSLPSLTADELRYEVLHNDSVIEQQTGRRPKTFCYPYNAMSDEVVAFCSEGRVGTRTFQASHGQRESHQTLDSMKRWLDDVISREEWGVTMTHGTTYGWDMWDDPQQLYDFFAVLRESEPSVWVAPFANVAAYIAERDHSQLSWTANQRCLVLTPMLDGLDTALYDEPLTYRINGTFRGVEATAKQGTADVAVRNLGNALLLDAVPNGEEVIVRW